MTNGQTTFLPSLTSPILDESVGERKIYYRLGDSELFTYANQNTLISGKKLIDVIPLMTVPDQGFTQIELNQIDKPVLFELFDSNRFKINCKKQIIDMLDTGKIVLVYSETYKIPTSIPYIVQSNKANTKIFVNVSDFMVLNSYGIFTVTQNRNFNALMAILVASATAYKIVGMNNTLPADLADGMVLMYAGMLNKCINSIVHMDKLMQDKIRYLATEFALIQMYGTEKGTDLFYRYKAKYYPKLTKMITDSIDNQFQLDNFDKLSLFVEELKRIYPSMANLSELVLFEKWIQSFGAATAMSVDYLGYHLYTICMVLFESPLVTRVALEPIMDKSKGVDMYKRIQALIC